jgi:hypothetical protein
MTRMDVIEKALKGPLTWLQAAVILNLTARHVHRLRLQYEQFGVPGLRDHRTGRRMPQRLAPEVVEALCQLRREKYADFSIRHFHQFATERHGLRLSYTMTRTVLQARGLAETAPGRGQYRRKRERRPIVGMLVHLDASTHAWLSGVPMQDLVVALDDADGRLLYARFVPQEGTASTFAALHHVLVRYGRFGELYTDRGSHFAPTQDGAEGQVRRALRALGIRSILARSPQARGRSERAFGTIQGRLPQALRVAGITTYDRANADLDATFVPDFNARFTVTPAQPERAFVPVRGLDLRLILSRHHERVVRNDSTVTFERIVLQLPATATRAHYVRCPVVVHEFPDDTLGVSYQGQLLAQYTRDGTLLKVAGARKPKAA